MLHDAGLAVRESVGDVKDHAPPARREAGGQDSICSSTVAASLISAWMASAASTPLRAVKAAASAL